METTGNKIKRLRKDRDLSLKQLSNLLKVSDMTLLNIETGKTKSITVELGKKLCNELGCSFVELFEIEVGNTPKEDVLIQLEELRGKLEEMKERIAEKDQLVKAITNQNKQLKAYLLSSTFLDHWAELSRLEDMLPDSWDENEKQSILSKIDNIQESINHDLQHLILVGAIEQSDVDEFIEYNKQFRKRSFDEYNEAKNWIDEQISKKKEQLSKKISPDQSTPTIP